MCKKLIYLFSFILVLGLAGPVAAQDMEIGLIAQPPVIDGEVDEIWAEASIQNFVPLEDPANASGIWQVLYDAENLYVLVDMTDDSLQNDSAGSWQDDSVEIYFDGGNTKVNTPLSGDDHQYTFGWTTDDIQGTNIDGYTEGIEHAQVDTDTGWRIEVKMPWLSIWGVVPQAGDLVGIDCYYNDDDDGGDSRENKLLSFSAIEGWNDASQWGTAVLADVEVEKTVLFAEDFEGLALGPNVDEAIAGDAVWTDTPPEGWIVDESGIPGLNLDATDGVTEWAGWAFADKEWWIEAAEDQDRSLFELGSGIVAVADPDEWDDAERLPIPIEADPYDTWLTTPEIKIASAEAGTLELKFDSSWRPEFDDDYHQTANITASFDGGDPVEVMLWESDEASANYKPYATNETVVVKLDNPEGAKKVVLTFGLFDAGNDWWWAIDNIEVRGVVLSLDPVDPGTEGLVAYYALYGDPNDSSGNGLNGTLVGDATFAEGPAGYGMALDLDGDGDYVDCGNDAIFSITDAFTLSVWINWRATGATWQTVVAKGDNAWRLARGGDTQTMDFGFTAGGDRGWQAARTASEVPLGEWHHVTATIDTTDGAKIYLDGVLEGENPDTGGITVGDYPVLIGENAQALNRFWDGLVDEVMIYNRVLSEAEVRYLAGQRATPVDPGTDGLAAAYEFEADAADSSGNALDGTLLGDAHAADGVLVLDGDDDAVAIPGIGDGLTEFTFTMKVYPTVDQVPLQFSGGINTDSWGGGVHFKLNYGNVNVGVNGLAGGDVVGTSIIEPDIWTHLALTVSPDEVAVYVNGEKEGSRTGEVVPAVNVGAATIGAWNNGGTDVQREMTGMMDDVLFYNRALSTGEIRYLVGIREFSYEGDTPDETWDHDNGSDQWDGTGPGEGNPGGAVSLTEDGVTFLRIQDTGDPRDYDMGDPGSNRKVYLTRLTDISLDGLRLEVRARVATSAPLDDMHPDGGTEVAPWPAEGIGYHIRDGGKGMIGVSDGVGIISFSLAQAGEAMFEDVTTDVLIMNSLVGTDPTSDVDTEDAAAAVALNMMVVDDATQWNTFVIDIVAGGAGTHVVTVSANGGPAESFDVTLGSDLEADAPFIAIGSSGTGGITAFDVDSLSVSN